MALVSNGNFVATSAPRPLLPWDELGSITPIAAFGSYYGGGSVALSGLQASYAAIYTKQLWIYVLVRKRAKAISRLDFRTVKTQADGSFALAGDSQFAELMARPNRKLGPKSMWRWTTSTRDIYGEAIWLKVRDGRGRVRELWPMHPTNTITVRDPDDGRWKYVFTTGARNAPLLPPFDEDDVVHFRDYNPDNLERGLSPLEPLRETLLNEDAARRASTAMWGNGARPSMALTVPNKLSDVAYKRLKAQWSSEHSGVDSWAKTAILEEGLTPHPISLSAEELQYIASRQLNREEACAAYDMPPSAVHILDHATYSNITEQARSVYRDSIGPDCDDYSDTIQHQLIPDFTTVDGDVIGAFDMSDVLEGTFEDQIKAFAQAIQTGQMKPREARRRLRLPDVEGDDQLLVNAALLPLRILEKVDVDAVNAGEELAPPKSDSRHWPTPADPAVPAKSVKALSVDEARTVQGRLSRAASVHELDPAVVTRGLNGSTDTVLALLHAARARGASVDDLRQWINGTVLLGGDDPKELTA